MIGVQEATPPFVRFKVVAKDDPKRSVELGYRVTRDVDYALVMPKGGKDEREFVAQEWLASIKKRNLEKAHGAYPDNLVKYYHDLYDAWKRGLEPPVNGVSIREWPMLSPAQVENFLAIGIQSIEDVADMTEEAMARVGMGARGLKEKAREWLKGKEISDAAMQENIELKKRVQELEDLMKQMLEAKPKRGRPPKIQEAA